MKDRNQESLHHQQTQFEELKAQTNIESQQINQRLQKITNDIQKNKGKSKMSERGVTEAYTKKKLSIDQDTAGRMGSESIAKQQD